ncbi:MAG: phosphatase PAP2 family protein [Pseudomonadota bacterium]
MSALTSLVHLGDLTLTVPAAIGISAWFAATRAWRMALWWSGLFMLGIGLVGASKIAFLVWGLGIAPVGYKAASGHAAGAMAVLPVLFYLLLQGLPRARQLAGSIGVALGLLVALALVLENEHTLAEALAGCALGATASLGILHLTRDSHLQRPASAWLCFATAALGAAILTRSAPTAYWMIRLAQLVSGNTRFYWFDSG